MRFAKNLEGARILATRDEQGLCPSCDELLVPKLGPINAQHWSHKGLTDCDPWSEHESPWHLAWKSLVPVAQQEVVMGPHRADLVTNAGLVVELQHSSLHPWEIAKREDFYGIGKMVWLWDLTEVQQNMFIRWRDGYQTFRWLHPRKRIASCRAKTFLDLGDGVFELKKMYSETPCGGWGYLLETEAFARQVIGVDMWAEAGV